MAMTRDRSKHSQMNIAILSRAPISGHTKTRLIPLLGADGAVRLQGWLLRRTVTTALAADCGPVTLWCTPDTRHPDFLACQQIGLLKLRQQADGDLGSRMLAAIAANTPDATLVIGTDCAAWTPELLRQAAAALTDHPAVLIPAEDGGYVLIGLREPEARIFSAIQWGTPQVLESTRQRLQQLGWSWAEFPPLWDVDRSEDARRLFRLHPEAGELAGAGT